MKSVLICPERSSVAALSRSVPLANISVFGKELIHYWIEHLAAKGVKHLYVLASDRPELVRSVTGDGTRWGITIDVLPVRRELTIREARKKMRREGDADWLAEPEDVIVVDHFPGLPGRKLFASYQEFFATLEAFLPQAAASDRIGLREIRPGIWAGLRAQISPTATLTAPCWISDYAIIGPDAVVGPMAIIESCSVVASQATVRRSVIAPETFIGKYVSVEGSIANRDTLIDIEKDSCIEITDAFLLCGLQNGADEQKKASWAGRIAALATLIATAPIAGLHILSSAMQGVPAFQQRHCVTSTDQTTRRRITYHQLAGAAGFWKRWPELWNVVKGEFCWVGNRPLTTSQAESLMTEFERLWLAAPIGVFSQADASGSIDEFSDEARAHSAFYATQNSRGLDFNIMKGALRQLSSGPKHMPQGMKIRTSPHKPTPIPQATTR